MIYAKYQGHPFRREELWASIILHEAAQCSAPAEARPRRALSEEQFRAGLRWLAEHGAPGRIR